MKKRLIAVILTLALTVPLCLSGCGSGNKTVKDNEEITMYLWDKSMSKQLTHWLEEQFPDISFSFVVGYNSMDYYSYLESNDVLPDILTCRRFSLNDAAYLSGELMDMSQTELVGSFYNSYIENNRETDGAIRWLPMCAEVDGYMANKDLFDKYDIPLPTNYAEFVDACRRFEELGIAGFMTDYNADYTCLETMQGCAIPELMSLEGTMWRRAYESETGDEQVGLDDQVWPVVFEKFEQYLKDIRIEPDESELLFADVSGPFLEDKVAIMRATANDCVITNQLYGKKCVMLPYFGETAEDNWLLTYPMCQVAVNKAVEKDEEKKEAVMKVMEAIFSEEGQRRLASGTAVLSYNKSVNIEMSDALELVKDCVESNHLYIRLASTEIFAISKDVTSKMILGEYGAQGAYEDFNAQLTAVKEDDAPEVIINQKNAYDYTFGEHGSPAVSSLMNTIRKGTGNDIAIGYSNLVSTPVFAGEYTEQHLKWLMAFKAIARQAEYTGAEIRQVMEWLVNVQEDGSNPIRHRNNIPATSGMEYTMKDNGDGTYTLDSLSVNGKPLDENAVYSVLLLGEDDYIMSSVFCNCPMPEDLMSRRQDINVNGYNSYDCFLDAVKSCGQLEAPSDYVTILR